jgi:hypothetical protein
MSWRIGCSKRFKRRPCRFSAAGTENLKRGPPFLYLECERLLLAQSGPTTPSLRRIPRVLHHLSAIYVLAFAPSTFGKQNEPVDLIEL